MKRLKISVAMVFMLAASNSIGQQNGNVVTHFVKQGENISTVARQYHTSAKEILKANYLTENSIISIGQKLIVPVTTSTKSITTVAAPKTVISPKADGLPNVAATKPAIRSIETSTKVNSKTAPDKKQYLVVAGDNLTKIARQYKTTEKNLSDWNNLKNDVIKAGSYIYIENPQVTEVVKETPKKEIVKPVEEVKITKTESIKKIEPQPKQVEVVKVETKPIIKEVIKEIKSLPTNPVASTTTPAVNTTKIDQSFFEPQFVSTKNAVEGTSGTFKTITGWHDKKYYALLNNAENGSIVKITANNKTVYAKVLGPLPNIKNDNNLSLRVSNAAAAALGVSDKFDAKVEF